MKYFANKLKVNYSHQIIEVKYFANKLRMDYPHQIIEVKYFADKLTCRATSRSLVSLEV
jgi:hypothetical protein